MPSNPRKARCLILALLVVWGCGGRFEVNAQDPGPAIETPAETPTPQAQSVGQRHAVIIAGLPGDEEHAALFAATTAAWRGWLTETLDFAPERVLTCASADAQAGAPATRESMGDLFQELAGRLTEDDSLWVLVLGHGNYDGRQSFLHVAGPDPDGPRFASWLEPIRCREQVVWLTQTCSGWWVKPLSRPGRIIVAATAADQEENETEFPHALTTVAPMNHKELDANGDGHVSVLELFVATSKVADARFAADERIPTEHAQLDDNGDGRGTEVPDLKAPPPVDPPVDPSATAPGTADASSPPTPAPAPAPIPHDGQLAATVLLSYRVRAEPPAASTCAPAAPAPTETPAP
jgi:hypothetical protein